MLMTLIKSLLGICKRVTHCRSCPCETDDERPLQPPFWPHRHNVKRNRYTTIVASTQAVKRRKVDSRCFRSARGGKIEISMGLKSS